MKGRDPSHNGAPTTGHGHGTAGGRGRPFGLEGAVGPRCRVILRPRPRGLRLGCLRLSGGSSSRLRSAKDVCDLTVPSVAGTWTGERLPSGDQTSTGTPSRSQNPLPGGRLDSTWSHPDTWAVQSDKKLPSARFLLKYRKISTFFFLYGCFRLYCWEREVGSDTRTPPTVVPGTTAPGTHVPFPDPPPCLTVVDP